MDHVTIFDTTLRDGEQSPGVAFSVHDKLEIAHQLDRLGVDIIEVGFPANSKAEIEAVRLVAAEVRRPTICALARALPGDVDSAWEAIKGAENPRIHVFISSSDIHLMHQLHKNYEEVLELARAQVAHAKGYVSDVEFSPMDATRSDPEYVYRLLEEVIEAGATTVNIPDTVGYATTEEFRRLITGVFENVRNIDRAVVSVHCHDDLGLAVANSLAAVEVGARQVEVAVNGIGERAGNCSLEEVVMGLHTRRDHYGVATRINTTQIYRTSRLVSELANMPVQPNKAIVGANAFRHESGIHADGVLKERTTYEIMDAKSVGVTTGGIVLGKLSGRHAFRSRLKDLGYSLSEQDEAKVFRAFQELATKKAEVDDRDLEAIVAEELRAVEETYHLDQVQVSSGDRSVPTASVRLIGPKGEVLADAALGNGPVDAIYKAITKLVGLPNKLVEFSVQSVTETTEAIGQVTIRIESDGRIHTGRGVDTDILVASAKAYVNALNRMLASQAESKPSSEQTGG